MLQGFGGTVVCGGYLHVGAILLKQGLEHLAAKRFIVYNNGIDHTVID